MLQLKLLSILLSSLGLISSVVTVRPNRALRLVTPRSGMPQGTM
jgi:hypothetical protein